MITNELKTEIFSLDDTEKIFLIEDLWDSIHDKSEAIPAPAWHVSETMTRYEEYKSGSLQLFDWEDVHSELRKRLR